MAAVVVVVRVVGRSRGIGRGRSSAGSQTSMLALGSVHESGHRTVPCSLLSLLVPFILHYTGFS